MVHDGHGIASLEGRQALGQVLSCDEVQDGQLTEDMKVICACSYLHIAYDHQIISEQECITYESKLQSTPFLFDLFA
jgi:hypothetical protein